jgi:hypothetical protein
MMSTTAPGPVRRALPADAAAIAVVQRGRGRAPTRGLLPQEYLDGLDPADRTERWRRSLERNDWPANARARRFYARAGWTADGSAKLEDIAGVPVTEVRYRRPLP